jgi:hypothetical protein
MYCIGFYIWKIFFCFCLNCQVAVSFVAHMLEIIDPADVP